MACIVSAHHVDLTTRQIEADGVTLEAVNAALALFEIDGISG